MSEPVTLRELIEARFKALDARLDTYIAVHTRAHETAEGNADRRLEEMNALRDQIISERGLYVTHSVVDARLASAAAEYHKYAESNASRITLIEQQISNWQGRLWAAGALITLMMALVALAVKFL